MRTFTRILLATLLGVTVALSGCEKMDEGPTYSVDPDEVDEFANPNRVIVRVVSGHSSEDIQSFVAGLGGRLIYDSKIIGAVTVVMPDQDAVDRIRLNPSVSGVEQDAVVFVLDSPEPGVPDYNEIEQDPDHIWGTSFCNLCQEPGHLNSQVIPWGIDRIGAMAVHHKATGAVVKVAVLDTGIYKDHPDLVVADGINFSPNPDDVDGWYDPSTEDPDVSVDPNAWVDDDGHGTHVAGIIAARDNCSHVIGVAPDVELYAVKVLDRNGLGYASDVIAGLEWAIDNGIQVVNMSIGGWDSTPAFADACAAAEAAGIYLATSAGNSGDGNPETDEVGFPGAYPSVITIAATNEANEIACFSSDGPEVDHAAPGVGVESTTMDGKTGFKSGTSMAAPHNAGAAALLFGYYPNMTVSEVREALSASATDLGNPGYDVFFGHGLINIPTAFNKVDKKLNR